MKIKLINPNTTESMTKVMTDCAKSVAFAGTEIVGVSSKMGPASIESHYDDFLAVPGVLQEIEAGEKENFDAYIIGCFGDPGLLAARELAKGPVIGIAEGAMVLASLIASSFSIVTTLKRTVGTAWHLAEIYGMKKFCKNVRACEIAVLDLENQEFDARKKITEECQRALDEDNCEAIVLGCAGMADLCQIISQDIKVPVIDGVTASIKLAESLVSLGLKTSKIGELNFPLPKTYNGFLKDFSRI